MTKQPTKADLYVIINNLEAKLEALSTQPPAASVEESLASIEATLSPPCDACDGTGIHSSGGMCYRCKGKGYQDASDVARNAGYARIRALRPTIAGKEGYASPRDIPLELRKGKTFVKVDGLFYER
jgi:DnaJ-class molecular chaperone